MAIADWLGFGKDPVLEHLAKTYGLRRGGLGSFEGSFRGFALQIPGQQGFAKGIQVDFGECSDEACFGFYRPDPADLRKALEFAADGLRRWEEGKDVRIACFFLDYEGDARWRVLLERHMPAIGDVLARYSVALDWVYLHHPGLSIRLAAPAVNPKAAPDLPAIERDLATSVQLLECLRDLAAREGLAP